MAYKAKYYCSGCDKIMERPDEGKKVKSRCETAGKIITLVKQSSNKC